MRFPKRSGVIGIVAGTLIVAAGIGISAAMIPSFDPGTYSISPETEGIAFEMPLRTSTGEDVDLTIETSYVHSRFGTTKFRVAADDCLETLRVNGIDITDGLPFCDYTRGTVIDLAHALQPGPNAIVATVHNNGGPASFILEVPPFDLRRMGGLLLVALGAALIGMSVLARAGRGMLWVFAGGIAVRMVYLASTHYNMRGYDTDGHIEYIRYVIDHWAVPSATEGWQFYQAPLYYTLMAIVTAVTEFLSQDAASGLLMIQFSSFFLSITSLVLAAWIVKMYYPKKTQSGLAALAFALYAFFPATVFFVSRINNDVLLECLGLASIGCLMRWWKSGGETWWYASAAFLALGLLTKTNAILLAPVLALCLLLKPGMTFKRLAKLAAGGALILVLVYGWYLVLRTIEGQTSIVGNLNSLSSGLLLTTDWQNMVEFNPVRIFSQPYNNPWNDAQGRQYFWEYLFRSAFTGEFSFGATLAPLASLTIFLGLVLFALSVVGGWHTIRERWREWLPVWTVPIALLLAHAAHKQFVAPYSSSQDFRFSILVVIPLALLAVHGMGFLPWAKSKWPLAIGWTFVACSAIFLLSAGAA